MVFTTLLIPYDLPDETMLSPLISFAIKPNHPDVTWLNPIEGKSSITIEQVHTFITTLYLAPYISPYKVAIISFAHKLTIPAQQALLKIIEEPPNRTHVFLATSRKERLLPTIRSRCTEVQIQKGTDTQARKPDFSFYTKVIHASPGEAIALSQTLGKNKEEVVSCLEKELQVLKVENETRATSTTLIHQCLLMSAIEEVTSNGNIKLVLEHYFLGMSGALDPLFIS